LIIPFFLAVLNLFLGIALIKINYKKTWNRVTGWIFILNAIVIFGMTMSNMAKEDTHYFFWFFSYRSLNAPIAFMIIYLALIFPKPILSKEKLSIVKLGLILFVLIFGGLYLFEKDLFHGVIFISEFNWYNITLRLMFYVYHQIPYIIAFIFCAVIWFSHYLKEKDLKIKKQLSILIIGFLMSPVSDISAFIRSFFSFENEPYSYFFYVPLIVFYIPFALYVLIKTLSGIINKKEYDKILFFGLIIGLIYAIGPAIFSINTHYWTAVTGLLGFGLFRPICFTYAVLKYQLFNINIIVKRSAYVVLIVFVLGLVFAGIQQVFEDIIPLYGILSALIVAVLFIPVENIATRITNRVFPWDETSEEYINKRSREIYAAAVKGALEDAVVTEEEKDTLRQLRYKFHISKEDQQIIDREIREQAETKKTESVNLRKVLYYLTSIFVLFFLFVVIQELLEITFPVPPIFGAVFITAIFIPIKFWLEGIIIKKLQVKKSRHDPKVLVLDIYSDILKETSKGNVIEDNDILRYIRDELGVSDEEHERVASKVITN